MKKIIVIFLFLVCRQATADCTAPDMKFNEYDGNIYGFKVEDLWDDYDDSKINKDSVLLIKYGFPDFLISAVNTDRKPVLLNANTEIISQKLLNSFKRSSAYLDPEDQIYSVSNILLYDLTGDLKEDLIFFKVSPGANSYPGVVGIINDSWKVLVMPTCF